MTIYLEFIKILDKLLINENRSYRGLRLLDVGCFTGGFLSLAKKRKADVYGLELQKDASEIASTRFPRRITHADILSHNYKKGFDIITMFGLIEHVTNPSALLKRMKTMINTNGIIMIQTPNSQSLPAKIMGKYWPPYSPVEHIHIYSKVGLVKKLEELGFKILCTKNHWKVLRIDYIFNNLQTFGPEFYKFFLPLYSFLPKFIKNIKIPVYIGEMIVCAVKT